ncbi:MAG: threonylcarbamoyl-AMP synthase [Bifidobacteriaceae bacterium]|jgi:tRNA threonylcarbamoyl adenosine modification protein (Sua5/YciO/YrdC/YwlC family)|nr:threonylcarbamoyl-AMP synthase [Bifidobacteriaceae bacterium]
MLSIRRSPDPEDLAVAVAAIARGQLVALPTDTVFGLAADPRNESATARVFAAKRRPRGLPLPVLVAEAAQARRLALRVGEQAAALMEAFWPGPLTLILEANPGAALHLGVPNGAIALRQPDHPFALALLKATGPLAVTSANVTGQPPALTAREAEDQLGAAVACYIDAEPAPRGIASTIVDCTGPEARLARQGGTGQDLIRRALG